MSYSIHIPLPGGTLKIKSERRLRTAERYRHVPTFHFGSVYFVWEKSVPKSSSARVDGARRSDVDRVE